HIPRIAMAAQNGFQYIHTTRRGAWTASCGVLMAPPFGAILRPAVPGRIGKRPDPGFQELRIQRGSTGNEILTSTFQRVTTPCSTSHVTSITSTCVMPRIDLDAAATASRTASSDDAAEL